MGKRQRRAERARRKEGRDWKAGLTAQSWGRLLPAPLSVQCRSAPPPPRWGLPEGAQLKAQTLGSSKEREIGGVPGQICSRDLFVDSEAQRLLCASCLGLWFARAVRIFPDDNPSLRSLSDSLLPPTLLKLAESLRQLGST